MEVPATRGEVSLSTCIWRPAQAAAKKSALPAVVIVHQVCERKDESEKDMEMRVQIWKERDKEKARQRESERKRERKKENGRERDRESRVPRTLLVYVTYQ